MNDASIAVFLSYASPAFARALWRGKQDAEAARRIAGSLRGAGVEVWFDQSELSIIHDRTGWASSRRVAVRSLAVVGCLP
jgi:hypothetical protein